MAITFPSSIWTTYTWPYPRIWFTQHYNMAAALYSGNVYLFELVYNMSAETWDAYYVAILGDVDEISQIDIGDFGMYYTASVLGHNSSGTQIAAAWERIPNTFAGSNSMRSLPSTNMPSFVCSCNFNGRIIVGGIIDFSAYLVGATTDPGFSSIWWSGVGSHEFRPNCDPTAGFLDAPWIKVWLGEVLRVEKLGDAVIGYGDYGKIILKPHYVDPSAFLSSEKISGAGIDSGNHISGDDNLHGFIDTNNEFWLATADHKFEKIGYKEYIEDMTKADIIVTYVPQKKKFFISDGKKGYCLTEFGLYSINQLVSGAGLQKELV